MVWGGGGRVEAGRAYRPVRWGRKCASGACCRCIRAVRGGTSGPLRGMMRAEHFEATPDLGGVAHFNDLLRAGNYRSHRGKVMGVGETIFLLRDRFVGGILVIELYGELDIWSTVTLAGHVESLLDQPRPNVVVDLRAVTFLDASGLRLLLRIKSQVAAKEGVLRLVRPAPRVWRVLRLTRLDRAFTVLDGLPAALEEPAERGNGHGSGGGGGREGGRGSGHEGGHGVSA
ncbi:STAS domain-containing protein [Streptomyces sp. NPDC057654]|uniref:STAS domain-containing protein n=1 Tax=Streptomyces sp. NPDC057654 TaxID=3346196 RepID=UPI0036A985BF